MVQIGGNYMTLLETLRKDKMAAMKEKDSVKNGVLGLLISSANLQTKELHRDLTKEEEMAILTKELKQTNETLASIPKTIYFLNFVKKGMFLLEQSPPQYTNPRGILFLINYIKKMPLTNCFLKKKLNRKRAINTQPERNSCTT